MMNKKGFTLIELLGVIVIIGLVIGISVFGIFKLIDKSKSEGANISEESIIKAASIYAIEKNNDDGYWNNIVREGYEGKYFCVTVEELINKGFLPKDKDLGGVDPYTFVGIKKDNVTLVNSNPILLSDSADSNSDLYKICTGNIVNENITNSLIISDPGRSYTDEITDISFSRLEGDNVIVDKSICYYNSNTSGNYSNDYMYETTGNSCYLEGLEDNTLYYIRVCSYTKMGSVICDDTSNKTKIVNKPSINLSDRASITYDVSNIKGNSYYYFMSSINGKSDSNVNACTLNSDNSFSCNNDSTSNVSAGTWYKSSNKNISLTYSNGGNGSITARTYDKSNNYSEIKKNFVIYKVTFDKGSADTIDSINGNIDRVCLAEVNGKCNIKSPSISKKGYDVVGWNTDKNSTSSTWNASTNKSNPSGTYYPITKAKTIKVTFYRNNSTSDSVTASQTFTYGVSGQKFSSKGWSKSGYNLAGWALNRSATSKDYNELSGVSDTWILKYSPEVKLYAVWSIKTYTITYNVNGGSGEIGAGTKKHGADYKITSDKPTKTGYVFDGWNTKSDGTGTNYASGATYKGNANLTLYAKWKKPTYTLRYDDNGGSGCSTKTKTITNGEKVGTLCTPSRRGYWYFLGWYNDGTKYTSNTVFKGNSDLTLKASWYYDEPEPEPDPEPDYPCVITGNPACRSCASTSCTDVLGSYSMTGDGVVIGQRSGSWTYIVSSSSGYGNCWVSDVRNSGAPYSCSGSSGGGGSSSGGSSTTKEGYCSLPSKLEYIYGDILAIGGMTIRNSSGVCEDATLQKFQTCFTPGLYTALTDTSTQYSTFKKTIRVSCSGIYKSFSFSVTVKSCSTLGNSTECAKHGTYCKWNAGYCQPR